MRQQGKNIRKNSFLQGKNLVETFQKRVYIEIKKIHKSPQIILILVLTERWKIRENRGTR